MEHIPVVQIDLSVPLKVPGKCLRDSVGPGPVSKVVGVLGPVPRHCEGPATRALCTCPCLLGLGSSSGWMRGARGP